MRVVDASIIVRLLQNRQGDSTLRERFGQHRLVHAPSLIDAEVASAVRGLMLTAKPGIRIGVERAEQMLEDFADLPIERHSMTPHLPRVLSLRENLTAYDAFYVALAEALSLPLLTDDRKFDGAPGHTVSIEVWT